MATRSFRIGFYGPIERLGRCRARCEGPGGVPATTDRDLVDDLLRYANARGSELDDLVDGAAAGAKAVDDEIRKLSPTHTNVLEELFRTTAPRIQEWLCHELGKLIGARRNALPPLDLASVLAPADLARPLKGPIRFSTAEALGSADQMAHRYAFPSLEEFAAWCLVVLRSLHSAGDSTLCRCHLRSCGRFFLLRRGPTGRPRSKFCSSEHMNEAHKETAAQRVAASRARRRLKSRSRRQHK